LNYARIEPLGWWFAERLLEVIRADEKRLKERGFNQVELFAKPLARRLGILTGRCC
jgi:predicted amidophosphoribosyltransferase